MEYWQEERKLGRREMFRYCLRWAGILVVLGASFAFLLWRSRSAVDFAVSRVHQTTPARYRVFGTVRSASSGAPVHWPVIADSPETRLPRYRAEGRFDGSFDLMTVAEPHDVVVSAHGFIPRRIRVGKAWFLWMPSGEEKLEIHLTPERP